MKRTGKKSLLKKMASFVLVFGLCISGVGMMPVGNVEAEEADANPVLKINQEYATIGEPLTASITGMPDGATAVYTWSVDGGNTRVGDSYTPTAGDLEKMLTVTADILDGSNTKIDSCEPVSMYISKLPVVYINTNDGAGVTSKENYKDAVMRIQGNERFQGKPLYDGKIEIRGRGNTTWEWGMMSGGKLPYKIKLDKKANLLGFGENKHWVLLGNYLEESLLRNKTSYDLAGKMGVNPHLPSANVDLIFNGEYVGNYQLVGNVRIHESRVNIFNWEDCAEDAAKALAPVIAEDNTGMTAKAIQKELEDILNEDMAWITSDSVEYPSGSNKTYKVSDHYAGIPKKPDGTVDVSGGFLFELDAHYDEASQFKTKYSQPMLFKAPEFVITNKELFGYAQKYIQALEDCVHSADFYTNVQKVNGTGKASEFTEDYEGKQHYTDLVDMDSLVSYLMLNEFYWNTETMKQSTFMYKDVGLNNKLQIGPLWDMDWTSNSLVSIEETSDPYCWMVTTCIEEAQEESWYRYLIGDPYFVENLYECYWENRDNFYEIIKEGGIIDQELAYLKESGDANYNLPNGLFDWGNFHCKSGEPSFTAGVNRLKTFLTQRLSWLDGKFGYAAGKTPNVTSSKQALDALLTSLGKFEDDTSKISVTVDTSDEKVTTYTVAVSDTGIQKVGFYINGILAGTQAVTNGTASLTVNDRSAGLVNNIENKAYVNNIVQVRGMNGDAATNISNYALFQKEIKPESEPDEATLKAADDAKTAAEQLESVKSQYTTESYAKLQTAYEALCRALESNDAEQIKQATDTLNQAIQDLQKVDDKGNQDGKKTSLVGTKFIYQNGNYQITKDSGMEYTVTYLNPTKKTLKNAKIPATASYNGISYKVTAIADKAFAKNKKLKSVTIGANVETIGASAFAGDGKLKKIIVQTSVLKTVGKKALNGIASNCKIKVPKNMLKAYKKTFKKKGQKSSVRIVK